VLALPRRVAFAALAGVPRQYGLYTAIVPCIVGGACRLEPARGRRTDPSKDRFGAAARPGRQGRRADVVALGQSISIAKALAARFGQPIDANRQFIGQGFRTWWAACSRPTCRAAR
jgi:hypothetical protein